MPSDSIKDKPAKSRNRCIHELFEEQVQRTPDAVAVVFENEQLTYRELNSQANQLAHYLRRLGVAPEVLVAISVERSLQMIVGILGILKAGGAYVPLDPAYPQERLAFILDDSQAALVLTQESLLQKRLASEAKVICIDKEWKTIAQESDQTPDSKVSTGNLAYVIYTSGSTGGPKGALVTHQNVVRLFTSTDQLFSFDERDVWTLFHSFAFDFSVWEIWGALLYGGRLIIVPHWVSRSPESFYELISKEQVTILNQTPSAFRQLVQAEERSGPMSNLALRFVIFGGEALDSVTLKPWLARHGDEQPKLINMYGITETTVHVTCHQITANEINKPRGSLIGRPIQDLQVHVLDPSLQRVLVGESGEMYVGGAGLARGYLNRAELAAERFIPDPLSDVPGSRLYRTGDLARLLPESDLEYLGRADYQVKIRGFRVELGEIETTLSQHAAVRECVVVAREDEPGSRRLVAYVLPDLESLGSEGGEASALESEQITQWQTIWEDTYKRPAGEQDPTFNTSGWNSSYTGKPYSTDEVIEWVDHTVNRILALKPKRVLEVGCGTGLLLFRIAPYCEQYFGTDPTPSALRNIETQLAIPGQELSQVSLEQRMGDDFSGIQPGSFDTVILNSVAHHFPSLNYMMRFLEGAVKAVRPGGSIFVGDLRNFALLEAFHASVQLFRASPSITRSQLLQRVKKRVFQEDQLTIDPRFFSALKRNLPQIANVEIKLKRGHHRNEITRFRYDAILHVGADSANNSIDPGYLWLDWQTQGLTLASLRQLLLDTKPPVVAIRGVPNARLEEELKLLEFLAGAEGPDTVADWRNSLRENQDVSWEPEIFSSLAEELSYFADITWLSSGADGTYDVVLRQRAGAIEQPPLIISQETRGEKPWSYYANNPLQWKTSNDLLPRLRSLLKEKLPEYMIPAAFVVLDEFPLTANGKVDRKALPIPDQSRPELGDFVAPRTPTEELLAGIWATILKLNRVGVFDNFFELGGHSLLATQVISRVRDAFEVELPLRCLFESPTTEALARIIEKARQQSGGRQIPPLLPTANDGDLPLSFAQQRLWFLQQLHQGSSFYNTLEAIHISGSLNLTALRQTFNEIVARHESLRTTFATVDGKPVQVIAPTLDMPLPVFDLSAIPEVEREAAALNLATEQSQEPIDLANGPLVRANLLRLDEKEHILVLIAHHIVTDGWSTVVLFRELAALYEAFAGGHDSPLSALPIQYADYAVWQREWLQGDVLEQQLSYWKQQLAGAPSFLELPTDRARPVRQAFRGSGKTVILPKRLGVSLLEVSQREGVTLFMTLLAAFQTLLSRYTGEEDIVVGSPIAGRTQREIEGLIGFFVNTLVFRTDLSGNPTFRELLRRVRDVALGAYAHQDVPFEKLVEELQPDRDLSRNPVFQVMLAPYEAPLQELDLSGLTLRLLHIDSPTTKFDLTLFAVDDAEGLRLRLEYNTDLFDESTITRMLGHLQNLLEGIVNDPEQHVSELQLLSKEETECLLVDWNDTQTDFSADNTIHELFEAQVERSPNAIAVVFEDRRLTYDELNARANQLAHLLRRRGVAPNECVALCVERSAEMVIGLMGILKAGCAYVPLNPDNPKSRLLLQIRESQCRVVLTQEKLSAQFESFTGEIVSVDQQELFRHERESNPEELATAGGLVYVIYTSGSTGVPKGVAVSHRNLVNYTEFITHKLHLRETSPDNQLHFATVSTISADLGNTCIFPSLLSGGCLHILSYEASTDSRVYADYVSRQPIDVLKIVPSHLNSLLNSDDGQSILPRKYLIFGGEALSWDLSQRVRELSSACEVINHYGPTETTVGSLTLAVGNAQNLQSSSLTVPIGRPVANTKVFILDKNLKPVPIGVPGQLYIGGAGVAQGYLKSPEQTRERFIANPFSDVEGERLYQTGDRVRYLAGGNVEFLGRVDDQVKIRGYRIEPAEIEVALLHNPGIKQAVVIAREDRPGDKTLVAYVVAIEESESVDDLRSFLLERLPDYMLPAAFVFLDELPLTINGKIDRRALPAPFQGRKPGKEVTQPRTPDEEVVARIWADVLNLDHVDIHDNFFFLGGHSLLITQVISRVRERLTVELPVRSMFEAPTVASFCEAIARTRSSSGGPVEPRIERLSRDSYRAKASLNEPVVSEP